METKVKGPVLDDGNENTKYFHGITNAQRQVNRISSIHIGEQLSESREDIDMKIKSFYKQL